MRLASVLLQVVFGRGVYKKSDAAPTALSFLIIHIELYCLEAGLKFYRAENGDHLYIYIYIYKYIYIYISIHLSGRKSSIFSEAIEMELSPPGILVSHRPSCFGSALTTCTTSPLTSGRLSIPFKRT
jgi:hypothetical protein